MSPIEHGPEPGLISVNSREQIRVRVPIRNFTELKDNRCYIELELEDSSRIRSDEFEIS